MKRTLLPLALLCAATLAQAASAAQPLGAPGRVVIPAAGFAVKGDPDIGGGPVGTATPDGGVVFLGDPDGKGRALVKLLRDGRLDASFGERGVMRVPYASAAGTPLELRRDAQGRFVLVLQGPPRSRFEGHRFRVARFLPDGRPDMGFGTAGVAEPGIQVGCGCASVGIAQDGSVLLAGQTGAVDPSVETNPGAPRRFRWAVARLTAAGTLDGGFGERGIATLPGEPASGFMAAVLEDGRIVTTAQVGTAPSTVLQIARLLPSGSLDMGYGKDGLVTTPLGHAFHWLVDPDGMVTLEGRPAAGEPAGAAASETTQLVRFTPAGGADATFGSGGIVRLEAMEVVRLVRESARDTLVLGSPGPASPTVRALRLSATGTARASATVTPAFGGGIGGPGRSAGALVQNSFDISDVLRRPDGSFLLVGSVGVVRYTGEGAGLSSDGFAFAPLTPALVPDRNGFGGVPAPARAGAGLPRQRASTVRRRRRVLVDVRASRPSLVRIRVRIGGRTVAQDVVASFGSGRRRYAVPVLRGRAGRIRAGRAVTATVTVRNLVAQHATVRGSSRLR